MQARTCHAVPVLLAANCFAFAVISPTCAADLFCDGLWQARNSVFARNGHCFKTPEAQALFGDGCFPPYGKLAAKDQAIVDAIKDLERRGHCSGTLSTAAATNNSAVPQYAVTITLSSAAKAKLETSGESISVAAYYSGEAKPGATADEMGEIQLGTETKDTTGDAVILGGMSFPDEDIDRIVGGKPNLLINVFSSRKIFENNILDCGIWQDAATKAKDISIHCKLIGER